MPRRKCPEIVWKRVFGGVETVLGSAAISLFFADAAIGCRKL